VVQPLAEQVGVVTGASRGIGAATAVALAEAGMAVVLGARLADAVTNRHELGRAAGLRKRSSPTCAIPSR